LGRGYPQKFLAAAVLLLILTGCQQKTAGPPPRYAFLRFENLSGDPTLEWAARAASEVLSQSLDRALDGAVLSTGALNRAASGFAASPADVPGASGERSKAELAGANRLISGYFERVGGKLRFSASEEDLSTHKTVRLLSAEGPQPLAAIRQLASEFSPSARPALTQNPEVLRLYASALEEPTDRAVSDLQQAVRLDPSCASAWVSLIDALVLRGDRSAALDAVAAALGNKLDPAHKASVELQKAVLENDRPARLAALKALSDANPADLSLLRTLAESEVAAGDFAKAAAHWKRLREVLPEDRNAWNQFGYALAWSGDFTGALQAMKEYGARWPSDPNPLDSAGDVDYMYGKFADAAANYLKANEKNPQFLAGGELYKAAWAQFRAGDKVKAETSFEQFRSARQKTDPSGLTLFGADWLYRTGREKQAMDLLRKAADASPTPAAAAPLRSQLIIWDLLAKDRATAQKDAAIEATGPGSNMSTVARFAALPSASAEEWQNRADTMLRGAGVDAARRFALGVALVLDGKNQAARSVWEKIVEADSGTDFFARNIAARLRGEKPKLELEIVPDSSAVNQIGALPDKL
jgi:Flp pilus assembly protein TadD